MQNCQQILHIDGKQIFDLYVIEMRDFHMIIVDKYIYIYLIVSYL